MNLSVRKIQRRKARIRANSALTCCKSTASFLSIAVEKSKLCLVRIRNIVKINKRVKKMIKQKAHQEVLAIGALGTPSLIAQALGPLL